jgi:hypothetical protein
MRRLAAILALVLGLTLLAAPPVSAAVAAHAENRASGSAAGLTTLIEIDTRLSEEAVRENAGLAYDLASDDAVAARGVPRIKPGSAGGPTAGQRFPESVREAAKAENPTATCVFCQRPGTGTQVDHAIPRARGGNATLDNAQLACPHCNPSKGVGDFPKSPPPGYTGPWPP